MSGELIFKKTICFITFFLSSFSLIFSQTYKFYPTDDAFVRKSITCADWENGNNGNSESNLVATWTYNGLGCGIGIHRTFIKFDFNIANYSKYLYDNRAVLKLFHYGQPHQYIGAASENELFICMPKEDWSESTITWNNQPDVFLENQIHVPASSTSPSYEDYTINVSDFLRKWLCGENENYGMQIRLVTEDYYRMLCFASKENANSDLWPFLEVEYAKIEAQADDTVCVGSVVNLNCDLINAANPNDYTFNWKNINSGKAYSGKSISDTIILAGKNEFVVTVTNPWCQTAIDTVCVYGVEKYSVEIFSEDTSICKGDTAKLIATGANQYQWSNGESNDNIIVSPSSTTIYYVTSVDSNGCNGSDTITITVNEAPNVKIATDKTEICPGDTANLIAIGASQYEWSSGESNDNITVSPSSTTIYYVMGMNSNGCSGSDTITITVNEAPNLNITADKTEICPGDAANLIATGASQYEWSNGESNDNIIVSPSSTTNYYVTSVDSNGCSGSDTITITVNEAPNINIATNKTEICLGDTANLIATGASQYEWSSGESNDNLIVSPSSTTIYYVTGVDSNGCSGSDTITITVNEAPNINITANKTEICSGDAANLIATGASQYEWNNGESNDNIIVSPSSTTTYYVTGVDSNGCSGSDTITITVNEAPNLNITADKTEICSGDAANLIATGASQYEWSNGESNDNLIVSPSSTTTYYVTGMNSNGCSGSDTITITVNEAPNLNITADKTEICPGDQVILSSDCEQIMWYPDVYANSIVVFPTSDTCFKAVCTDLLTNCQAEDSINIIVLKEEDCSDLDFYIYMPNVFTPNEDGINDNFKVVFTGEYTSFEMIIFNRWGQEIFTSKSPDISWDGKHNGKELPAGTYFCVVKFTTKSNKVIEKGTSVTLLR
ncbi:MAG: gliding motility-associated C-terminal domain-containing protein [Bacteroidales bacterium]|nr:gliding motility-associated C-terminal domain-containing protein [Bacteroidales bacterium]